MFDSGRSHLLSHAVRLKVLSQIPNYNFGPLVISLGYFKNIALCDHAIRPEDSTNISMKW